MNSPICVVCVHVKPGITLRMRMFESNAEPTTESPTIGATTRLIRLQNLQLMQVTCQKVLQQTISSHERNGFAEENAED